MEYEAMMLARKLMDETPHSCRYNRAVVDGYSSCRNIQDRMELTCSRESKMNILSIAAYMS